MAKEIRGKGKRCHITFRQHTDISGIDVQAAVSVTAERVDSQFALFTFRVNLLECVMNQGCVSKSSELPT